MTQQWGRCLVIVGPSGSGKTRLVNTVLEQVPNVARVITTTTRAARPGEVDGVHYYFVSRPEFEAMRERGEFLEWAEYAGNLYGSSKTRIAELRARHAAVLAIIDTVGAAAYRREVAGTELVMVTAPEEHLHQRLMNDRPTTSPEELSKRLATARKELEFASCCDYVIDNPDGAYEAAAARLIAYVCGR